MILQRNRLSLQSPLRTLSLLVLHLLLPQSCTGQSQIIGPSQPIVAAVGDDVVLPCYLEPAVDVAAMTLEWTRSDLDPIFVQLWRAGQELIQAKNPSYKDRTSLSVDEVKRGNISLKLSDVKPSDQGTYQCYIPKLDKGSSVELVVGAVALARIDLAGMDRNKGGVMLNCESKGWYPEPEVLWLDGEGNLLSAGPPETVRGPDDLYTVSSRVTVEKRHSNRFTCRVQQKNINQTREAHIHVPDDFFEVQSSSSSSSVTGLAVCLAVCILIILLLVFFVWRQNKEKTRRHHEGEVRQKEQVKLLEEKHEAQSEVVSLKSQLESKNKEVGELTVHVQKLNEDLEGKKKEDQKQSADRKGNQTNEELMEAKTQLGIKETEISHLKREPHEERQHDGSSSAERLVIEVNQWGKFIRLRNTSCQDQRLGGWKLKSQINSEEPDSFTFDPSFILEAGKFVTMWVAHYGIHNPPTDLEWTDLKSWSTKDHLQVDLLSDTGEIKSEFILTG